MATTFYSSLYEEAPTGEMVPRAPHCKRPGEPVFVRGTAFIPKATAAVGDLVKLCPVVDGTRCVRLILKPSAIVHASATANIGWTSDDDAIKSAHTFLQATTCVEVAVADIGVSGAADAGDELQLKLGGTLGTNDSTVTFIAELVVA